MADIRIVIAFVIAKMGDWVHSVICIAYFTTHRSYREIKYTTVKGDNVQMKRLHRSSHILLLPCIIF